MKKALINFTIIVGIIAFIGACKKSDDSSSTAASTVTSCSETASGSITGIDNQSVSGTYSLMLKYAGTPGVDNSTGCADNATLLAVFSSSMPTGAASYNQLRVVTSSTTFADVYKSYSDTACSSAMALIIITFLNIF